MAEIRLLLVDDHNVLRQGMAQVLSLQPDMTVVAQADTGAAALTAIAAHRPDVVLLDIQMPDLDGLSAAETIVERWPEVGIIILTMYRQDRYVRAAIRAGVNGYLLKEAELETVLRAIRTVAGGQAFVDPAVAGDVMEQWRPPGKPAPTPDVVLSDRDRQMLGRLAQGWTNQQIADEWALSEKTVRNRLSLIFQELGLKNRTQAALYAQERGWRPAEDA